MSTEHNTYRYGPLEAPSGAFGLRRGQMVVAAAAIAASVGSFLVAVRLGAGPYSIAVPLVVGMFGVAAVLWPIPPYGKGLDQIGPSIVGQLWRSLRGRAEWRTDSYREGHTLYVGRSEYLEGFESKPPFLRHLDLYAVHDPELGIVEGLVHDTKRDEYVAVLPCRGPGTALLDPAEMSQGQSAYADAIASYGLRPEATVCAIGWTERIAPDQGEDTIRHMQRVFEGRDGLEPARENYRQLVEDQGPVGQQHELYLELVLDGADSSGAIHRRCPENKTVGAARLMHQEAEELRRLLDEVGVTTEALLAPRELAQAIRVAFLPELRQTRALMERHGAEKGIAPENAWPGFVAERMNYLESDGWYHRTYFVRSWPGTEVGPDFMAPLLRGVSVMRSLSVIMEPIPVGKSIAEWKRRQMDLQSRQTTQEKVKQVRTPADRAEMEAHERLGQEIADGHVQMRFWGHITVSAATLRDLEAECSKVTTAASQARLELEVMYGQQALGFAATLPLGRGR